MWLIKVSLICVIVISIVTFCEAKGGRGGGFSRGGSRGGGFSHSSGSKPSSTWFSSSSSRGSGSSNTHSYPSSNTGFSGTGYHPSGSSGSNVHTYPSSNTGYSGTGSKPSYPSSSGGSGYGNYNNPSSYNPYYPKNTGTSGSGYNRPSYGGSNGYGGGGFKPSTYYNTPHSNYYVPYHSQPQAVYINDYRNSGSRYSDLLTGLALYNLGRSSSHNHNYYHDDYYNRRYHTSAESRNSASSTSNINRKDEIQCALRIEETGKIERISIPCEIVSTFDLPPAPTTTTTSTVAPSTSTAVSIDFPFGMDFLSEETRKQLEDMKKTLERMGLKDELTQATGAPLLKLQDATEKDNSSIMTILNGRLVKAEDLDSEIRLENSTQNEVPKTNSTTMTLSQEIVKNETETSLDTSTITVLTTSEAPKINTSFTGQLETEYKLEDPLKQKGPKLEIKSTMKCFIEIRKKNTPLTEHEISCTQLQDYTKAQEEAEIASKRDKKLIPSYETLQTWKKSPPWWSALFFVV